MVLTDKVIKQEMLNGNIIISNYNEAHINPNSYDMTLNDVCKIYCPGGLHNLKGVDIEKFNPFSINYNDTLDCRKPNPVFEFKIPETGFVLKPNHLYLYSCNERIGVKGNICATVMGKSSLGRLGLDIHVCAGFIDSGFEGSLVLEMRTVYPLKIYPNMKICQIKFERTEGIADESYDKKIGSKYYNQEGVVESKFHENFK